MKKVKSKKKNVSTFPIWLTAFLVIVIAFLIISMDRSKDSRSSANDSVEPGVVLPVASDRE